MALSCNDLDTSWRLDLLSKLHSRNTLQSPSSRIYQDYNKLLNEHVSLTLKFTETSTLFMLVRKEIQDLYGSDEKTLVVIQKLRLVSDKMKETFSENNHSLFGVFLRRFQEHQNQLEDYKQENCLVKQELSSCFEKIAILESEISREKSDMNLICEENDKLKAILRSNGLSF